VYTPVIPTVIKEAIEGLKLKISRTINLGVEVKLKILK
jgi:hypothetical protein